MDNFSRKVRVFDAFPKVAPEQTVRSQRGGFSTLFTGFCCLFFIWIQIGGYWGGHIDRTFGVDKEIRSELNINLDILVAESCKNLVVVVIDETHDRYMAQEVLNFEGMNFRVPEGFSVNSQNSNFRTPDLDEIMQETLRAEFSVSGVRVNEDAPACHIFGTVPVNHVKGQLIITTKGGRSSSEKANFSHVISELSFGEFYPYINNPLDFTAKVTDNPGQMYMYFAKLVPTTYQKLGLAVETYQYSITEQVHFSNGQEPAGLFFAYTFEPIHLQIVEDRIPFFEFVAKLATILSGFFIAAMYLLRLYERVLLILFGKKYVDKDTEKKSGGLLDNESPAKEY